MMDGPIKFSQEALEAFRTRVRASHPMAVRFGVRGAGCNGFQYAIEFDYDPVRQGDIEWLPDGWEEPASFRVDKKSALLLSGSTVTFTRTLMKSGFEFENPHEASRCGCGHSFNAK
jgi:iron-sulfur cluster assembly protein